MIRNLNTRLVVPIGRPPMEKAMTDERIKRDEAYEIQYWCEKWGVSSQRLREAVAKVGPMAKDVARELGKPS